MTIVASNPRLLIRLVVLLAFAGGGLLACGSPPGYVVPKRSTQEAELRRLKENAEQRSLEGEHEVALRLLQRAESITRTDPAVAFGLATELRHLGRYDEALPYFERVMWLDPGHPGRYRALGQIGMIHRDQSRWPEAIDAFEQVIEMRPSDPIALAMLADLHFRQREYDVSEAYTQRFREVVEGLDPARLPQTDRDRYRAYLAHLESLRRAIAGAREDARTRTGSASDE